MRIVSPASAPSKPPVSGRPAPHPGHARLLRPVKARLRCSGCEFDCGLCSGFVLRLQADNDPTVDPLGVCRTLGRPITSPLPRHPLDLLPQENSTRVAETRFRVPEGTSTNRPTLLATGGAIVSTNGATPHGSPEAPTSPGLSNSPAPTHAESHSHSRAGIRSKRSRVELRPLCGLARLRLGSCRAHETQRTANGERRAANGERRHLLGRRFACAFRMRALPTGRTRRFQRYSGFAAPKRLPASQSER